MKENSSYRKEVFHSHNDLVPDKTPRGNLVYQQRQQMRRNHWQKKQRVRKLFELGKLIEKAGFYDEDLTVILGLLLEAKEKLQSAEAENT